MRPPEAIGHVADAPVGVELEPGPPPEIPKSPRAIAWTRRRLSAKRVWALYRKSTMGMIGLIVLIFFILVAVFAPLISPKEGLEATCPCNGDPLLTAVVGLPARDRRLRALGPHADGLGRADLAPRRVARDGDLDG